MRDTSSAIAACSAARSLCSFTSAAFSSPISFTCSSMPSFFTASSVWNFSMLASYSWIALFAFAS